MIVWWGTPVECYSAISRREREGNLSEADADLVYARLHALAASWEEVTPGEQVRKLAQRMLRVHPLRAADALQLAAAAIAADSDPPSLEFVSLDERLLQAARLEGFPVWGPQ